VNLRAALVAGAVAALACGEGASSDPGTSAGLRVSPAQFVPGAAPDGEGGPLVAAVELPVATVTAGGRDFALRGFLDRDATAVAIQLRGDEGHWVATAGLPDTQVPDLVTFDVRLAFAPDLPPGPAELVLRAVDARGRAGEARPVPLTVTRAPVPDGALVITLAWDAQADLDLHVVQPDGIEIWRGNINGHEPPPPGQPPEAPEAWREGGLLDFDSNGGCALDGRRQESVLWASAPPPGRYRVLVDVSSLCGTSGSFWRVEARRDGRRIGAAVGHALEAHTRGSHGAGDGVLALSLDVE